MSFHEFWWRVESARLVDELAWRRTREVVSIVYNVNSKKRKTAKDLIPLSLDNQVIKKKIEQISLTEFKKRFRNDNK